MIKLFRRIRKQLLKENRIGKYLLYALGEIVLVVIGILIALSINNWNENKKVEKAENIILNDLKAEMESNIEALDNLTNRHRKLLTDAKIIENIQRNLDRLKSYTPDSIVEITSNLAGHYFYAKRGILNSILSSGLINSIKNRKLKNLLGSLTDIVEEKMASTKYVKDVGDNFMLTNVWPEAIKNSMNNNTGKVDMEAFKKEIFLIPEFRVAIQGTFIANRELAIKGEEELKLIYEQILGLIINEIELKDKY
ncbi:MAG: DUF6090 family protein [Flavobacteriaceae bacterium]